MLNGLDAHSVVIDIECAGGLTGGGADTARELWEVVGGMQHIQSATPVLAIHKIIPVRDDVVNRTAVVAKRDAAVHAARGLFACLFVCQVEHKLAPVLEAICRDLGRFLQPIDFEKSSNFSHDNFLKLL